MFKEFTNDYAEGYISSITVESIDNGNSDTDFVMLGSPALNDEIMGLAINAFENEEETATVAVADINGNMYSITLYISLDGEHYEEDDVDDFEVIEAALNSLY